jgi:hypothetical protein
VEIVGLSWLLCQSLPITTGDSSTLSQLQHKGNLIHLSSAKGKMVSVRSEGLWGREEEEDDDMQL